MKIDNFTTLEITGMKFHAFTGILPEEKTEGVDLEIDFKGRTWSKKAVKNDDISETVDVRGICDIVQKEVSRPCNLLETLANRIVKAVLDYAPAFYAIKVKVAKLDPGLFGAKSWSATASYNWDNENSSL
ncbi:MAG: dihydroneopterin aldolase [Bacteroidales bacterium]|nr:dihydroneopterin aldolase [Bacteroidales bacterium]